LSRPTNSVEVEFSKLMKIVLNTGYTRNTARRTSAGPTKT
jgi:hypothetical protein